MYEEKDLAWAAGFLDGDGSFTISLCRGYFTPQVSATNKDSRPVLRLQEILGGRIYSNKTKPGVDFSSTVGIMYTWSCTDKKILEICRELLPHLVLKKDQAICLINIVSLSQQGVRITDEVFLKKAAFYEACSELNHTFIGLAATTEREGLLQNEEVSDSLDCTDGKGAEVAEMTTRPIRVVK